MAETTRTELVGHTAQPTTQRGGGCAVLFGLPFIVIGVVATLISAGYIPMSRKSGNAPVWMLSIFGVVFATAGLSVAWMGVSGMLRARSARRRKEEHATEPWYWDHPWDSRWAVSGSLGPAFKSFQAFLFFSAFLSMFNWWAFFSDDGPWPLKIFISLFDLIALAILLGAIYLFFQYLKYGTSRLHFARFPFRPGGSIEAGLEAHRRLLAAPSISLVLRYIEEVTEVRNSGKNRSTTQVLYCLHEVKQDLNSSQFDANSGAEIPINIRLPAGDFATRLGETPRRYWELEVKADTPGIDYAARFLIPVY